MDGTCGATYLLQSCEQGWSDGGHVVGVKRHPGTAHFLCKHSLLFELGHKGTDCFLKSQTWHMFKHLGPQLYSRTPLP